MKYALFGAALLALAPPAQAQETTAQRSDIVLRNPLAALRLEELASTRERPLFSPTRRPPPPPAEAPPPPPPAAPVEAKAASPEPPPFDLVGAVVGEATSFVLLRDHATNEVMRLRQGDQKDGWRVGAVSLRSASLERDGRVELLAFPSPATVAATPAPQLAGPGPAGDIPEPGVVVDRPVDDPAQQVNPQPRLEFRRLMKKIHPNQSNQ